MDAQDSDSEPTGAQLAVLYDRRFSPAELAGKRVLWEAICRGFLDKYVRSSDTVLDLAAGTCEFINACRAAEKIAVDLNPDVKRWAETARAVVASADDMDQVDDGSVDTVFSSNFFEHLASKAELSGVLAECRRVLRPGGRLLVLMPNLRYVKERYWDYFDHQLPLTHLSLVEGIQLAGFEVDQVIPRFLPYTVKSSPVAVRPGLVRAYLGLPLVWRIFGRQMFVAAHVRAR